MKRLLQLFTALVLLGSITIQAAPFETWSWSVPTEYKNETPIPPGDLVNFTLHCGMQFGGPYPAAQIFSVQTPPSVEDMAFVVANMAGTYYCVATVSSLQYSTTSEVSNEVNFTVLPTDLGLVPKPPTLLSLQ